MCLSRKLGNDIADPHGYGDPQLDKNSPSKDTFVSWPFTLRNFEGKRWRLKESAARPKDHIEAQYIRYLAPSVRAFDLALDRVA
jgi:hypothetical protein